MKRLLLGTFSGLALMTAGAALAADLPVPVYKAPVMVEPPYSWTGFYIGGNIGGSFGRADTTLTVAGVPFGVSESLNGIIGGLQAGYNWQSGSWLLGLEGDIQATSEQGSSSIIDPITTSTTTTTSTTICNPNIQVACVPLVITTTTTTFSTTTAAITEQEKLPWLGTARARVGFLPASKWLVYVTGGLAVGEVKTTSNAIVAGGPAATFGANTTKAGWTIGGGIEAALWGSWTGKVEYLYVDLGTVTNNFAGIGPLFTPIVDSSRVRDNIVRVGLNYRFP